MLDWRTVVMAMQGDAVGAIVGYILSFVVESEWFPKYAELEPKVKRVVFGALCLSIPLLGVILGIASGFQEPVWEATFWPALQAGGVAFIAGQVAHTRKLTAKQ